MAPRHLAAIAVVITALAPWLRPAVVGATNDAIQSERELGPRGFPMERDRAARAATERDSANMGHSLPWHPASLSQTQEALDVTAVATYGWESLGDSTRRLSEKERRAMGGVLARPNALVEGADGALYVLDRDFRKIVVFNRDGSLRRVILGGYGEGPGEFVRPRDMSLGPSGHVVVIDESLSRFTVFDTSGRLIRSRAMRVGSPYGVAALGDRYLVLRWYRSGEPVVSVLDTLGAHLGDTLRLTERDYEFSKGGERGKLGMTSMGEVLYAHPTVGRWTSIQTGVSGGNALVPDMHFGIWKDRDGETPYTTAGPRGIGRFRDGSTLLYYGAFDTEAMRQRRIMMTYFLTLFDSRGRPRTVRVPSEGRGAFATSRTGQDFYLSTEEPFPRVVRYRINTMSSPRTSRPF